PLPGAQVDDDGAVAGAVGDHATVGAEGGGCRGQGGGVVVDLGQDPRSFPVPQGHRVDLGDGQDGAVRGEGEFERDVVGEGDLGVVRRGEATGKDPFRDGA